MRLRKRTTPNNNGNGGPPQKITKPQLKLNRLVCPNPCCLRSFRAPKDMLSHLQQSERGCGEYFSKNAFERNPSVLQPGAKVATRAGAAKHHSDNSHHDEEEADQSDDETEQSDADNEEEHDSYTQYDDFAPIGTDSEGSDSIQQSTQDPTSDVSSIEDNAAIQIHETQNNNVIPGSLLQVAFTPTQLAETKLLKILNDCNAPHYLYNQIMEWSSFC